MTSCGVPLGANLGPRAGIELMCTFFTMALWGVTCMQTFLYFFNNPRDSKYLRFLVIWLWVMDTVHEGLLISGSYKANIGGKVPLIDHLRGEYTLQTLITAFISVPTQAFFGYRIWRITGQKLIIPILLAPAVLFQLAQGIVFVYLKSQMGVQHTTCKISRAVLVSNFAVGAAVDILLSAGLCFLLWKSYMKENSSISVIQFKTNSTMHRLILFSINTGIWTALVTIVDITTAVVYPSKFIYVGFYFVRAPIYCNNLLANLNARFYLKGGGESMVIHSMGIASTPAHGGSFPTNKTDTELPNSV